VAHVGIQRFCSGYGENDGAQDEEARLAVGEEELQTIPRIQREEDARLARDLGGPEDGDGNEPERHQGSEGAANAGRSKTLKDEQREQDGQREHHRDRFRQVRMHHLDALDGAEHGDRRRDHPVAVEKGCAEEA